MMAGGKNQVQSALSPEIQQEQELMFRSDLDQVIGLIIAPPMHRIDEQGRLIWGQSDGGLTVSAEVASEFRSAMESIVQETASEFAPSLPLSRSLPSHPYSRPPAAQSIVEIAFMLWEHKEPIIDNLDRLITVGTVITAITKRARSWFNEKQQTVSEENPPEEPARWVTPIGLRDPIITLTQMAAAAAVTADAFTRYGVDKECEVHVYPRGNPYSGGPQYPDSQTTYLVRLQDGARVLVYVLKASGEMLEHYQLAGDKITPLPISDFLDTGELLSLPFPGLLIRGQPPTDD